MKAEDLRKKTDTELKETLKSLQSDMRDIVKDVLQAKEKDSSKVKMMRKDIARVKTVLNEKKVLLEIEKGNFGGKAEDE